MSEPTVQVSKTIAAPPERIWQALVTPAIIKRYFFGSDVESDFRVGSPIHFRGEFNGKKYEDKGEILEVKPGTQLSMSHWSPLSGTPDTPENYHVVTYDIVPQGDVTEVTLTQSNMSADAKPADAKTRAEYEKNWTMVLSGLEQVVSN